MNRRLLFHFAAIGGALAVLVRGAGAEEPRKKQHKIILHVGANDQDSMRTALGHARNAFELYASRGEKATIEIVANSGGLNMFREDTSPVKQQIAELRKVDPSVVLSACNSTKKTMEKREGKPITIIPEAQLVPAGVVRIALLEDQGYAYVRE
jgi:intracellular sulfur oxidation DsrE/DsrF family protein